MALPVVLHNCTCLLVPPSVEARNLPVGWMANWPLPGISMAGRLSAAVPLARSINERRSGERTYRSLAFTGAPL